MPHQHNTHRHPRSKARQFDLFAQSAGGGAAQIPEWRTLPSETRQALTDLMARLILDHANGGRAQEWEEIRHDD